MISKIADSTYRLPDDGSFYCYEGSCQAHPDPDDEDIGAPYCNGHCEQCDKKWGDESGI